MMAIAQPEALFDEITDFLVSRPTEKEIIAFKPSEALDQRLHELLDKNSSNGLSPDERAELNSFLHMSHLLIILGAKARLKLANMM
jgi:hypothetical protein